MKSGSLTVVIAATLVFTSTLLASVASDESARMFFIVIEQAAKAAPSIGHDQRERIAKVVTLIQKRSYDDALKELDCVVTQFEMTHIRTNVPFICAATQGEFERYGREIGRDDAMWLDWSYVEACYFKAHVASAKEQYDKTLALLDKAAAIAPYDPSMPCEKGNVYSVMHQDSKGLEQYKRARELAKASDRYKTQEAMALRGMGRAYVEMGELDKAEEADRKSLEIDPYNQDAKWQLKRIKIHRDELAASAATKKAASCGVLRPPEHEEVIWRFKPTLKQVTGIPESGYYNLVKKYERSAAKVWPIVNGEMFCNLTTDDVKRAEMSALIYRMYTNWIARRTKDFTMQKHQSSGMGLLSFEQCFEICLQSRKVSRSVYTNPTIGLAAWNQLI